MEMMQGAQAARARSETEPARELGKGTFFEVADDAPPKLDKRKVKKMNAQLKEELKLKRLTSIQGNAGALRRGWPRRRVSWRRRRHGGRGRSCRVHGPSGRSSVRHYIASVSQRCRRMRCRSDSAPAGSPRRAPPLLTRR